MKKMYPFLFSLLLSVSAFAQTTILKSAWGDPQGASLGNRVIYVNANNGELGSTDGNTTVDIPASTVILAGLNAALLGNKIVFIGLNALSGNELWSSDGTIAGTTIIKDINITPGVGSDPQGGAESFTIIGTKLYFTANDGVNGRELWVTDGTLAGTSLVKDITAGSGGSTIGFPFNLNPVGNTMYFTVNGNQLWKSDGTSAGTVLVKDFSAGGAAPLSAMFTGNGTYTFFVANDGTNGWELWRTDGTTGGTIMLQNIAAGSANAFSLFTGGDSWDWGFHVFNNILYFQPNGTGITGTKMYKTDGTTVNTTQVIDLNPSGFGNFDLKNSVDIGTSYFCFSALGELYRSDGTNGGTTMVKDINTTGSSNPIILVPRDNLATNFTPGLFYQQRFFLLADDGVNGRELWISNGTNAGTTLVKNINSGGNSAFTGNNERYLYTKYKFYFSANNGTNGYELWESDGSNAGTSLVQDINTGAADADLDFFGVALTSNKMVFRSTVGTDNNIYALNSTVVPFPLSLTDFNAQLRSSEVVLNWTTQNEVNVSRFHIQRSITGRDFATIASVNATGATGQQQYGFTDANYGKAGVLYYRLEMVDKDGKISYSKILSVKLKSSFDFNITNTRNETIISMGDVAGLADIRITDNYGRVQSKQQQKVNTGEVIRLATGHLATGIYYVTVEINGSVLTKRFVK